MIKKGDYVGKIVYSQHPEILDAVILFRVIKVDEGKKTVVLELIASPSLHNTFVYPNLRNLEYAKSFHLWESIVQKYHIIVVPNIKELKGLMEYIKKERTHDKK